jgi:hypothetical protein
MTVQNHMTLQATRPHSFFTNRALVIGVLLLAAVAAPYLDFARFVRLADLRH